MTDVGKGLSAPQYGRALREHWMYLVIAVTLAVAGALAYTHFAKSRYEASADILVSPVSSDALIGVPVFRDSPFGRSVVTAARITKSPQVASRVRDALHLSKTLRGVSAMVTVTPQQQSDILTITGASGSANGAAAVANAFAVALLAEQTARFRAEVKALAANLNGRLDALGRRSGNAEAEAIANRLADLQSIPTNRDPTLELVSPAVPPSTAVYPRTVLSVAVAAVIGLLIGIGIVVGRERFTPFVTHADAFVDLEGPPTLAHVPRLTDADARAALADLDGMPRELRLSMRTLWSNIGDLLPQGSPTRTLVVLSAGADEGAPALAATIAALTQHSGHSVGLIDADLERGTLASIVDAEVASVAGIGSAIASDDRPAVMSGASDRMQALLVQPDDSDLTDWLLPGHLSRFVEDLAGQVDVLVISAPPLPAKQTALLASLADFVIVAVALGHTRRDQLAQLRAALAEHDVVLSGFVLIDHPPRSTRLPEVSRARMRAPEQASQAQPSQAQPSRVQAPQEPVLQEEPAVQRRWV